MTRVFLHGFTGDPSVWRAFQGTAEPILGHAPHLLADPGPEGFVAEVDRLAARIADPVHLVGYSLGARLAAGLIARHPERIARATLIGVHPGLETEAERRARRQEDARWIALLEEQGLPAFLAAWDAQPLFATRPPRTVSHDPRGLALALRRLGLAEMPPLAGALGRTRVPLTLVVGARDHKFQSLARRIPARTIVVPGAGHDVVAEAPHALVRILEESP